MLLTQVFLHRGSDLLSYPDQQRPISIHATADRNRMIFKVSQLQYADGSMETFNLHASQLLADEVCPTLSLRDLLLTLNVTSKMELKQQKQQQRYQYDTTTSTSIYGQQHPQQRRTCTLCAIVPRQDWMVVSFGNTTLAVVGVDAVYLLDAHIPAVQVFAQTLARHVVQSSSSSSKDPTELVVLEHILRDIVEQFQRRLRFLEPIGTYTTAHCCRAFNSHYNNNYYSLFLSLQD